MADMSDLLVRSSAGYGRIKLIYMDGDYMIWYECTSLATDRSCQPRDVQVQVLGRTRFMPEKPIGSLQSLATKTCFSRPDFEIIPHQGKDKG